MDARRNNILKEIVETFIKTARPVGSKALCDKFNLSSATIRNEMAVLEELGYLEKNHVSSGRVPSESGYRYYVEHLMEAEKITGSDMLKLQKIFASGELELSDAINKCMEIISDITNYTSVVLGKNSKDNNLLQVSIIAINASQVVAVVCTDKGNVENKMFNIDNNININELIKTSEIINKMLAGTPIDEVSVRLERVYNIFYNAFNDFVANTSSIHIAGRNNIFNQPEYNDIFELKRLANKLDDTALIEKVAENDTDENEIKIFIGDENEFDPNVTIIRKKYHINGEDGTIAVIGPKRMDYGRIVSMLEYIDEKLDSRKDENGK